MSGFSDDGQWWWDGREWKAASQMMIPDLAIPQPESLRRSMRDRWRLGEAGNAAEAAALATQANPLAFIAGVSFLYAERNAFRDLRLWTLEQLASAATFLLGPEEPMVAGETALYRESAALGFFYSRAVHRDLAIAVTTAHVLLLAFDRFDGQPRSVVLAARAVDVRVEAPTPIFSDPTVLVRARTGTWSLRGAPMVMQPKPVVAAWRAAAAATTKV